MLSTSIGTSGVMFVHSDEVKIDPEGRVHTFCHAVRGKWHMMGVNLSAGGSLQWFRNALCQAEPPGRSGTKSTSTTCSTQEAAAVPPGCEGLFFLPYLSGERTPHADPHARGCFIGLTLGPRPRRTWSGRFGGGDVRHARQPGDYRGVGVPVVRSAPPAAARGARFGGKSRPTVRPQVVTINTEEGPAYGVALLAAVGSGHFKDIAQACAATISVVQETPPDRAARRNTIGAFPLYQRLYRSLKGDFAAIAA